MYAGRFFEGFPEKKNMGKHFCGSVTSCHFDDLLEGEPYSNPMKKRAPKGCGFRGFVGG